MKVPLPFHVLVKSPGEAVSVLPPAGATAGSTAQSSSTCWATAPSLLGPSSCPLKAYLEGIQALQRAFHMVKVSPSLFFFFPLTAALDLAFINEYCSSDHLGNGPDYRTALERAMKQQNPKEGNRSTRYLTLQLTFRRSVSSSVTAKDQAVRN